MSEKGPAPEEVALPEEHGSIDSATDGYEASDEEGGIRRWSKSKRKRKGKDKEVSTWKHRMAHVIKMLPPEIRETYLIAALQALTDSDIAPVQGPLLDRPRNFRIAGPRLQSLA